MSLPPRSCTPSCCRQAGLQTAWSHWLGCATARPAHCHKRKADCNPSRPTGRAARVLCAAEEPADEPPRQRAPPPHRIYRGTAGSPTSYPIRPPARPQGEEEDEDDGYEYINVGPQYQVPNAKDGPLERRVSMTFLEGMLADRVNLDETKYWFTEPPGGWNSGDKYVRAAKREPNNLRRNARNPGPGRMELHELRPRQVWNGIITALWLYEGIQVDIGAQWDGLVAIDHQMWETIQWDLYVGQLVQVEIFRILDIPRCKFPLQMTLRMPHAMVPLMMDPLEYEVPFDFEGLDTIEEREAATGISWAPEPLLSVGIDPELSRDVQDMMTPDYAAHMKANQQELEAQLMAEQEARQAAAAAAADMGEGPSQEDLDALQDMDEELDDEDADVEQ